MLKITNEDLQNKILELQDRLKTLEDMVKFIMKNTPTALHPSHKPEFSLQDLWDEQKSLEKLDKDIFDKPTDKSEKIEKIIDKFKEEFSGLRYFLNNSETNITFLDEIESWLRDKLNNL